MTTLPDKANLRPSEVARYFDVTRKTVYKWIQEGKLASVKIGGVLRIPRESILSAEESAKN
jgi:excisionase family DNA binding protein